VVSVDAFVGSRGGVKDNGSKMSVLYSSMELGKKTTQWSLDD
jgi:hypothetical protein